MCGIVGFVQRAQAASGLPLEVCLQGLKRLEYRGYDSAGVALAGGSSNSAGLGVPGEALRELPDRSAAQTRTQEALRELPDRSAAQTDVDGQDSSRIASQHTQNPGESEPQIEVRKKAGRLDCLKEEIAARPVGSASVAIAHTRWATHGKPTDANAHPHISNDGRIALIHNGIIENADLLRTELETAGVQFSSTTDSEVAVHLLRRELAAVEAEARITGLAAPTPIGQDSSPIAPNSAGLGVPGEALRELPDRSATQTRTQEALREKSDRSAVEADVDGQDSSRIALGSDVDGQDSSRIASQHTQNPGEFRLTEAMRRVANQFSGTFTLLAIDAAHPEAIVGARHDSPLVIGLGENCNYLGSDVAAFVEYTKQAIALGQDNIVTISPDTIEVIDFAGNPGISEPYTIDWDASAAEKGGYSTFMEKEIREEPRAVADTLLGRLDHETGMLQLDESKHPDAEFQEFMREIDKIIVVACGTAAYAGHVAKYAIEHWCRIPVEVELAHEFRYRDPILSEKTLVISISQSGETMDTLMAVRHAKEQHARTVSICNSWGATIPRESDAVLYTHAGPEVAVASTKAFVAQITAAYLIGLYLAGVRGNKFPDEIREILGDLKEVPDKIQSLVDQFAAISELAQELRDVESVLFLGRHVGYPVAMEGALKLKELAYIHAEGFAAGELKHGPIALIDEGQPVFVILPPLARPELHAKVISNIQEIRARGAQVFAIAEEGDTAAREQATAVFERPQIQSLLAPLVDVIPLQIFAFALATAKGLDVDQPRNLAKSVTVE